MKICSYLLLLILIFPAVSIAEIPAMIPRPVAPSAVEAGTRLQLDDMVTTGMITLYLPEGYDVTAASNTEVTMHFHGATWFAIQEHERRGLTEPLIAFQLGQGSTIYKTPFLNRSFFAAVIDRVESELKLQGADPSTEISKVNLTSFSAGYGSIREIVKSPEYTTMIQRIILADSSYASYAGMELINGSRPVAKADYQSWVDFGKLAMKGDKTLLMISTDIAPGGYAGTMEVCESVARDLGITVRKIEPDSVPASNSGFDYRLRGTATRGGFHWWAFTGDDPVAHMTVARRIADSWQALDKLEMP